MITVPTPTPEAAKLQADEYRRVVANPEYEHLPPALRIAMAADIEAQNLVWDGNHDLAKATFTLTEKGEQEAMVNLYD